MSVQKLTQDKIQSELQKLEKGNFAQVAHEMLEFLMNRKNFKGTEREYAIILFLFRELQGWGFRYKPIEINEIEEATSLSKQAIIGALKELVEIKKVLIKKKLPGIRTLVYGFNEDLLGRTIVSQKPKTYLQRHGKVIDLATFKVIKEMPLEVIEAMTRKRREASTRAAVEASKHNETYSNNLSREKKVDGNDLEHMKSALLPTYPKDEERLTKAYRQIKREGYQGKHIGNVCAYLLKAWPDIRTEFEHCEAKVYRTDFSLPEFSPEEEAKPETVKKYMSQFMRSLK